MATHYERLGVRPDATNDDIKRAWRATAKRLHPDRPGGDEAAFKAAQRAFEELSDPIRRTAYDRDFKGRPVLRPSTLDLGELEADRRATRRVTIVNTGGGTPDLSLDTDRGTGWRVASASGSTAPGAGVDLSIEIDTTGLAGASVDESLQVSLGVATAVLRIRFSVARVRSRSKASSGAAGTSQGASAAYGASGGTTHSSGTSGQWTTGNRSSGSWANSSTTSPSAQYPTASPPEPLPGWGIVLDRSRLEMSAVAVACGLVGPVLLALAFPEDTAAVLMVGLVLAALAIVVAVRSELFAPARMSIAGTGDQATTLVMTGAGLVSIAAVAVALLVFVVILAITLAVLYALASSD